MSIHLTRKKILCISFFLCCVLPACFTWFETATDTFSGLSLLELPLLIATTVFAFGLLFERPQFILPLGILSHVSLLVCSIIAFVRFPVNAGLADAKDLAISFEYAEIGYWVAIALILVHLALFNTTELAVRKLARHNAEKNTSAN